MAREWEATFSRWSQAPGPPEQTKMENAERAIRGAIEASTALSAHKIRVFPQGSYRNRTSVPRDSDVDICVVCYDVFNDDWTFVDPNVARPGETKEAALMREAGLSVATYTFADFKRDVGSALVARFGSAAVKRGDKAWDVHENSYRVEADVVAALEHRRYKRDLRGGLDYDAGTQFTSDSGKKIINWPEQHYVRGVSKNTASKERFKAVARILKNLCNDMSDNGIAEAKPIASFLIECLAYNVPTAEYGKPTWVREVKNAIGVIYKAVETEAGCKDWREVSEMKWLFRPSQPWTREQVVDFLLAAWAYDGLGKA